jgi:hypothetical protein
MKRIIMIAVLFICSISMSMGEELPFFDRVWVFPGFVKRQKLLYENGEYRYHDEVWQGGLSESIWQDGRNFFDWGQMLYIDRGDIYLVGFLEDIRKTTTDSVWFEDDGFSRIQFGEYTFDVIFGSFLIAFPAPISWNMIEDYHGRLGYVQEYQKELIRKMLNNEKARIGRDDSFLYQPVKEMIVPSCLSETIAGERVTYNTDFFKYRWVYEYGHVFAQMNYHDGPLPWVEAEPGDGTGVEFEVLFKEPVDNIVFLNGFVDMQRKHLYKQNARMKEIEVSGDGFTTKYTFIDQVRFQEIPFPKETEKIRVKVLSVYPGSKWEDMAISGMYVRTHYDEISEEEKQRRYRMHVDFIKRMYAEQQAEQVD